MDKTQRRNLLLDKGTEVPSQDLTITVGGEEVDVEVRALTRKQQQALNRRQRQAQGEVTPQAYEVQACTYDPASGERLFDLSDVEMIDEVPFGADTWPQKISEAINYVHGFSDQAPDGADEPRYMVIAQQAQMIQEVVRDSDDITGEVATKMLEALKSIEQNALGIEPEEEEGK